MVWLQFLYIFSHCSFLSDSKPELIAEVKNMKDKLPLCNEDMKCMRNEQKHFWLKI